MLTRGVCSEKIQLNLFKSKKDMRKSRGGGNPPKLELTGGGPGGDFLVNLGPKTLNNMGSSCKKEYGHRRSSISTSFPI